MRTSIKTHGSKIVIADDSMTIRRKLSMVLEAQGYQVFAVDDGQKCIKMVEKINPDLIILDLVIPHVSGLEVCRILRSKDRTSLTPIIILTSSNTQEDKNMAISLGANDYLNKSCETLELKLKVDSLLKLKFAIDQLENANNIIKSLAKAVEYKDTYTEGHGDRVSRFAVLLAREMGLDEVQIKEVAMAGLLHDIGKIGVPDLILNKPGKLTDEEFDVIKKHPSIGFEICEPIKSFEKINRIILDHHEKLNGSGYPNGIKSTDLNTETRIMTVVDIYDALTSDRAYRKGMDDTKAFMIMDEMVEKGELDGNILVTFKGMTRVLE